MIKHRLPTQGSGLCRSLLVLLALGPSPLRAQGIPVLDSTRVQPAISAGQYLMHWTTDEGAAGEQTIYLKNTSTDRAITITSWEVFDCFNVGGRICGRHDKGPTVNPGKTVRLATIRGQRGGNEGYSYRYRFTQQWVEPKP